MAIIQAINAGNDVSYGRRRRQRTPSPIPEPDLETGRELLNSGEFGRVESAYVPKTHQRRKGLSKKLWMRELNPRAVNTLSVGEVKKFWVLISKESSLLRVTWPY